MNWGKYKPYFTEDEFNCKDNCGLNNMTEAMMDKLLVARLDTKLAFIITSGSRCETHNKNEGGSENSDHLTGEGVDIRCLNSRDRYIIITSLLKAGFTRIGIAKTFIHAGMAEGNAPRVAWLY